MEEIHLAHGLTPERVDAVLMVGDIREVTRNVELGLPDSDQWWTECIARLCHRTLNIVLLGDVGRDADRGTTAVSNGLDRLVDIGLGSRHDCHFAALVGQHVCGVTSHALTTASAED